MGKRRLCIVLLTAVFILAFAGLKNEYVYASEAGSDDYSDISNVSDDYDASDDETDGNVEESNGNQTVTETDQELDNSKMESQLDEESDADEMADDNSDENLIDKDSEDTLNNDAAETEAELVEDAACDNMANGSIKENESSNLKHSTGWVNLAGKWKYYYGENDNDYFADGYYYIDDKKYCFDESGFLRTGWYTIDSEKRYSDSDGVVAEGWHTIDGKKYLFGESYNWSYDDENEKYIVNFDYVYGYGMVTGYWNPIGNAAWYFDKNGVLQTGGWIKLEDGSYCYANSDGTLYYGMLTDANGYKYYFGQYIVDDDDYRHRMMKNCVIDYKGKSYCLSKYGDAKVGWIKNEDGSYYYASSDASLNQGWGLIGGKWYYFGEDQSIYNSEKDTYEMKPVGFRMRQGEIARIGNNEDPYYFYDSGIMADDEFIRVKDNQCYYAGNGGFDSIYHAEAGGKLSKGWKYINNKWYYFDEYSCTAAKGYWADLNGTGKTYAFAEDGSMLTGWLEVFDDNNWYYFNNDGSAANGWLRYGNKWYYLVDTGYSISGEGLRIGGNTYLFDESGALVENKSGWYYTNIDHYHQYSYENLDFNDEDDVRWYYLNTDGTVKTGWYQENGKWYWFDYENGEMKKHGIQDGYLFGNNGQMIDKKGWVQMSFVDGVSSWFYLNSNSKVKRNEWIVSENKKYYLDNSGRMASSGVLYIDDDGARLFDENGELRDTKGWHYIDKNWYYVENNGFAVNGLRTIAGKKYYFKELSYKLLVDSISTDGFWYTVDYSGTDWMGSNVYCADKDGCLYKKTGWVQVECELEDESIYSQWFYLDADGEIVKDAWISSGSDLYYVGDKGIMVSNRGYYYYENDNPDRTKYGPARATGAYVFDELGRVSKAGWLKLDDGWYYTDPDGRGHNGVLTLGNKTYYIDHGKMLENIGSAYPYEYNYVLNSDGSVHKGKGFFESSDGLIMYSSDEYGHALPAGWYKMGNDMYFIELGHVLTGTHYLNGLKNVFDSKGRLISRKMSY